ncbi:AAA family ATPase [Desulfitobacterium hafniense]|uniref:AAA family ATPase n=1 Tax=Desulfitobacterium hafniense TaxID=49338 RepID=UPI00035EFE81|nr:AAA family ATPase [Desulfitobacterium hafniense]
MKIEKIRVNGLFGLLNHEINMRVNDNITIIHGPNGFGKTTLLKMINALLNINFLELHIIPFEQFELFFSDGSRLLVNKNENNRETRSTKQIRNLEIIYYENEKTHLYNPVIDLSENLISVPPELISDFVPNLMRMGIRSWRYIPTEEILSLKDVILRFNEYFPEDSISYKNVPDWFKDLKKSIPIQYIKTQRLIHSTVQNPKYRRTQSIMENAVSTYSIELAKAVETRLTEYGKIAQTLDRSFPSRLVRLHSSEELKIEDLSERLKDIDQKRQNLISLGLLDNNSELNIQVSQGEIDERTKSVLSIYVKDMEDKLEVFDELAEKIDLLRKIISPKFKYKKMIVDKDKGIMFETSAGKLLTPEFLSSGEQHQLVLFYELLFKTKPNSLILIDEPELSFHVAWQIEFLNDLQEITKIVSFDVLIATHSPQIINDRWDLTEELGGEGDE